MSRVYDVLSDFGLKSSDVQEDAPDAISTSPSAILVVWRYKHPVTFSRQKGSSFSTIITDAVTLREKPLFVTDDLQNLSVQSTKGSHVSQMSAVLHPGMNYLTEIFPEDWVAVWIGNDVEVVSDVISAIESGEPANGFRSGLKFLGRVAGIRKRIQQQPGGVRTSSYTMTAAGFTELDASIYYEPQLAANAVGTSTEHLRKTGVEINKIIADNGQGIDLQKAISLYLHAFFGAGVPKNQNFQSQDDRLRITAGLDDPNVFIIPDPVAKTLGVTKATRQNGAFAYTDILELLHGIQTYQLDAGGTESSQSIDSESDQRLGMIFAPDNVDTSADGRDRKTSHTMIGTFLPTVPQFTGQRNVWSILQQYLNPTINEMYTCLRPNPQGQIFPTLVVRQLPFSSGVISEHYKPRPLSDLVSPEDQKNQKKQDDAVKAKSQEEYDDMMKNRAKVNEGHDLVLTRFAEVPRWLIHPILIKSVDLGRSDAARINFVHIQPEIGTKNQSKTAYLVRDPPVRDDLDTYRAGLRPYMMSVPCHPSDARNRKAGEWQYIMSDILMGGHLLLNGTMETQGIQSPICPGDNIEFDGHVLHIEAISHRYGVGADGGKQFQTSLTLTHGMSGRQSQASDLGIYAGSRGDDLTQYDPGLLRETGFSSSKPSLPETGAESSVKTGDKENDRTKDGKS
jgi:hypothetical protein